ncbi:MAG: hypothetical protein L0216_05270 [Planctomycetales bacterium]|nr:hypothetical protein [Planctomycetales bacterium]
MTRRRALGVGAAATALAAAVAIAAPVGVRDPTHADSFCLQCHQDLVSSHGTSAHRFVACVQCHMDSGASGEVVGRWHGFRHLRLTVLDDPLSPHHPPLVRVPDVTCRGCHNKLTDELTLRDLGGMARPSLGLAPIGLRTNHSGHLGAQESCARCHGEAHRPLSQEPLRCARCHAMVAHGLERTARARSFAGGATIPDALLTPSGEALRCSDLGRARCSPCHNGLSHGNGTKPPSLPNVLEEDDAFTCRRCHPAGRW